MKLTHEFINAGASKNGGWSQAQLALFGLKWPLKKGWKRRLIGREVSEDIARMFLHLKDQHLEMPEGFHDG